jgi:hypothetical protein
MKTAESDFHQCESNSQTNFNLPMLSEANNKNKYVATQISAENTHMTANASKEF